MTASSTPEQSARAILAIFKFRNCYAGDPLEISYIKTQFLENHGSAADYDAGLIYAEDYGWLARISHTILALLAPGVGELGKFFHERARSWRREDASCAGVLS